MTLRAGVYSRVSTEEQTKGYSISEQIEKGIELAKDLGADEVIWEKYIDDGYSGADPTRPGINNILEDAKKGYLQLVICYDVDRWARDLGDQLFFADEVEKHAKLDFVTHKRGSPDSPEDNMFFHMKGAFAEYERAKIRQRTTSGRKRKAKSGKIVFDSRPYGYKFDKRNQIYIPQKDEAEMVRNIFQWYVEEGLGLKKICERLAQHQYPTRKGKKTWTTGTVYGILHNPIYIGDAYFNRVSKKKIAPKKFERTIRPEEEWILIPIEPIIDVETFLKVGIQAEQNIHFSIRNSKKDYILRGLVNCGVCGEKMRIRNNNKHVFFTCMRGKSKPYVNFGNEPDEEKCPVRTVKMDLLEEVFLSEIKKIIGEPIYFEEIMTEYKKEDINVEYLSNNLEEINKRIKKLLVHRKNILGLLKEDLISEIEAKGELKQIKKEEDSLLLEKKNIEYTLQEGLKSTGLDMESIKEQLTQLVKAFESANFETKRKTILTIVEKIEVIRYNTTKRSSFEEFDMTIKFKI